MKSLKIFLMAATMLLTLNTSSVTASTLNITDICSNPLSGMFNLNINGVNHSIVTPFNSLTNSVTVRIVDNGMVVFECTAQTYIQIVGDGIDHRIVGDGIDHRIVGDGIDHRIVGDGIDHRIVGDGIDHRIVEVSQGGVLLFEKQL